MVSIPGYIDYLFLCDKLPSKLHGLKQQMVFISVSVGQKLEGSLAGPLGFLL